MNYFSQTSQNLIYRKLTLADIAEWIPFFSDNPNLPFLGLDLSKTPEILAREWIERQIARYEHEGFGHLAVIEKSSGKFVGMGGILPRNLYAPKEFEIGYHVLPRYWRKGYGTEIAQTMHQFGLTNGIADYFISIIAMSNEGSIKVAERNDMALWKTDVYSGMNVKVFKTNQHGL